MRYVASSSPSAPRGRTPKCARVVATDPPAEATLGRDQQFFVRIQFDADEPVSLWTRAYAGGKRIEQGYKSNASAKW